MVKAPDAWLRRHSRGYGLWTEDVAGNEVLQRSVAADNSQGFSSTRTLEIAEDNGCADCMAGAPFIHAGSGHGREVIMAAKAQSSFKWLACFAFAMCLTAGGCFAHRCQTNADVPRELAKVPLPPYVIEPPDILLIDTL